MPTDPQIRRALELLDKRNVLFSIHGASFPVSPEDDLGVGTPHSSAAWTLFEDLKAHGYTGVLLGPEGETRPGNPSPYDGQWFSRTTLLLAGSDLVDRGFVTPAELRMLTAPSSEPLRANAASARARVDALSSLAWARRSVCGDAPQAFGEAHAAWLEPDATHAALSELHGSVHDAAWPAAHRDLFEPERGRPQPERWATLRRTFAGRVERHAFTQWLIDAQRRALRDRLSRLGLDLWGDLQIGPSPADAWRFRHLFLPGYSLGAPPSRTNPEGQPWGYPVWNPDLEAQVADQLVGPRLERAIASYDGLRIDHPHGWVCPWIYRTDLDGPHAAVRAGARVFESPDLPDHPSLARFARVGVDQLHPPPRPPRHADDWVVDLTPAQVDRYAAALDRVVTAFARPGRAPPVAAEVLSTQPYPLARVTAALGLGRFRVTQKADPDDPDDVYRSDRAAPEDWVMVGNHDTPSIWSVADAWVGTERGACEARMLARRLGAGADEWQRLERDAAALAHAKVADAFASPARNVIVFFADHFGLRPRYNTPGTVSSNNWTLRAPASGLDDAALNLRRVLADALRIRFPAPSDDVRDLQDALRHSGARTDGGQGFERAHAPEGPQKERATPQDERAEPR